MCFFFFHFRDPVYVKSCISSVRLFFHPNRDILCLLIFSIASIKTSGHRIYWKFQEIKIFRFFKKVLITLSRSIFILKHQWHARFILHCLKCYYIFILYLAFVIVPGYFLEPLKIPICCTIQNDWKHHKMRWKFYRTWSNVLAAVNGIHKKRQISVV